MKNKILPVILLSTLSLMFILGCGSSSDTEKTGTNKVETNQVQQQEEQKEEVKKPTVERYKLGDIVKISTEHGDYEICFTAVEETDYRNQFEESNPKRVVIISYEYKNLDYSYELYDGSISNEISINSWDVKLYDKEGNLLDTYPATMEFGSGVTPGHKGKGEFAYGLDDDNNYIELEYSASLFDSFTCVFDLEW